MTPRQTLLIIFGTRPEAIKLAPVVRAFRAEPDFAVRIAVTGQHREMLAQVLAVFGITPTNDLAVMTSDQSLTSLTSRLLPALDRLLTTVNPDAVLVQGDTTTAFVAALAAFYRQIPIGHVEAGLRTRDRYAPFPEEINRRLLATLTTWHFAPTVRGRAALLAEGVADCDIVITGNTIIDALDLALKMTPPIVLGAPPSGRKLLLVTAHRRESFGVRLDALCHAVRRIAEQHPNLDVWFPVHLNPNVREPVMRNLAEQQRIHLLEPLDYVSFVHLLARADLVLTDSGGIQEEASTLGKPVLVMRNVTERPEGVEAGVVELVGTDEERIVARVGQLLEDPSTYEAMSRAVCLYGDGQASRRIVTFLRDRLFASY